MIHGIRYTAPVFDGSGYAEAARNHILALHSAGVSVTINPTSCESARPDLGESGKILESLVNRDIEFDINLIKMTPEFFKDHYLEGKINVFYTPWETSRIHPIWTKYCNDMQGGLVSCRWNLGVFQNSGVTVPLRVQNYCMPEIPTQQTSIGIDGLFEQTYKFLSVFQWTERKNPVDLLKAYWLAFEPGDDVVLILKTYKSNHSTDQQNQIRQEIMDLKVNMPRDYYAPVYFIGDLLSSHQMHSLYEFCDCFVLLDRGEGFGLPHLTAAAHGKPVISTDTGGTSDFLNKDNSYRVQCFMSPVCGMPWIPWYRGDQLWAQPDVQHAADQMLAVYNNRENARAKGEKARQEIHRLLSWNRIAENTVRNLESIKEG